MVWCYLLLNATHKERQCLFGGKNIILKPGELITGRKKIAVNNRIDKSKVERILKLFKGAQQIEQQTSNANRLISIVNWDSYQSSEQQSEQPLNNQRTTSEQPVNTNKNDKNDKKKELSDFEKTFDDFKKMRKQLKKPMTDKAEVLLINKLNKLANTEEEKIEILNNSIMNSWIGVFELKDNKPKETREKTPLEIETLKKLKELKNDKRDAL